MDLATALHLLILAASTIAVPITLAALDSARTARAAALLAAERAEEIREHAAEIHVIVNQERTDRQRYQQVLVAALTAAGLDVPQDASLYRDGMTDARPGPRRDDPL